MFIQILIFIHIASFGVVSGQIGARSQPETTMGIYTPEQHDLYDGHFIIEAKKKGFNPADELFNKTMVKSTQ